MGIAIIENSNSVDVCLGIVNLLRQEFLHLEIITHACDGILPIFPIASFSDGKRINEHHMMNVYLTILNSKIFPFSSILCFFLVKSLPTLAALFCSRIYTWEKSLRLFTCIVFKYPIVTRSLELCKRICISYFSSCDKLPFSTF